MAVPAVMRRYDSALEETGVDGEVPDEPGVCPRQSVAPGDAGADPAVGLVERAGRPGGRVFAGHRDLRAAGGGPSGELEAAGAAGSGGAAGSDRVDGRAG